MPYNEDTLEQQTTTDYLERELGWDSVYAYNNEDFGPDSLLGHTSDREVVLTRILHERLMALNPGLPDAAYDDAVRQITTTVASQTLAATNREKYAQLRDGVQVTFRNDKSERVRQRLRVLDFETPGAVDMATLLKGVCEKRNFLDLVENFILFDETAGEPKKIIARNHQFLGVNRAIESVRERKARQGKLRVFWHTQGSGKSYSMVMCREVFKKFKACINVQGINAYRSDRDAINIVYKSLQQDREQADITDIIRQLHQVVDEAIEVQPNRVGEESAPYDISQIDFDRLRQEFERSPRKNTTVQDLRQAVEQRLLRLLQQNPLRTDFQQHYENIVSEYNREKDRVTIEKTFEALFKLVQELDEEESRAVREGLDKESLAVFDLIKKPGLNASEIKRIKSVAAELLARLKAEKLRIDHWRDKETTRDAVRVTIHDYLWSDNTGLPVDVYTESDVDERAEDVFTHVYRAYPTLPSPFYSSATA